MTRLCQKLRTRKTCVKNLQQHMKCMQYGSSSPPPWGCPPCPALLYGHRIPALFCSQEWGPLLSTCSFPPTPWQIPLSKALGWRLIQGVCSKAWDASKFHPPPKRMYFMKMTLTYCCSSPPSPEAGQVLRAPLAFHSILGHFGAILARCAAPIAKAGSGRSAWCSPAMETPLI